MWYVVVLPASCGRSREDAIGVGGVTRNLGLSRNSDIFAGGLWTVYRCGVATFIYMEFESSIAVWRSSMDSKMKHFALRSAGIILNWTSCLRVLI